MNQILHSCLAFRVAPISVDNCVLGRFVTVNQTHMKPNQKKNQRMANGHECIISLSHIKCVQIEI